MGRETLPKVWDRSGDPRRGPGLVGGPFLRSGTGWGTLGEVQDWSGALSEVRDRSGDPPEGLGRFLGPS